MTVFNIQDICIFLKTMPLPCYLKVRLHLWQTVYICMYVSMYVQVKLFRTLSLTIYMKVNEIGEVCLFVYKYLSLLFCTREKKVYIFLSIIGSKHNKIIRPAFIWWTLSTVIESNPNLYRKSTQIWFSSIVRIDAIPVILK